MVASGQQNGTGYKYTVNIHLTESAGTSAKITSVNLTMYSGGLTYARSDPMGPEAWIGSNDALLGSGTLDSNNLVFTDDTPSKVTDRIDAKIAYTDNLQNSGTLTLTTNVPVFPISGGSGGTGGGGTPPPPAPARPPPPPSTIDPLPATSGGSRPTCSAASLPATASCVNDIVGTPTAVCNDHRFSCSAHASGTCSSHGGVYCWACPGVLCSSGATALSDESPVEPWLMTPSPTKRLPLTVGR
jgi:hypothetical protein